MPTTDRVPLKIVQSDLTGDCVRLNRRFDLVEGRVSQLGQEVSGINTTVINNTSTTVLSLSTHVTLTTDLVIPPPASATSGAVWTVRIDQDGVGGHTVFWTTDVHLGPQINPATNSKPNTMCLMIFAGFGTDWYLVATPVLGVRIV